MNQNIFSEYLGQSLFFALMEMNKARGYMSLSVNDPETRFVSFDSDIVSNRLDKNIADILEAMPPLPDWAGAYNLFEVRVGAVLSTRDGRRCGNSTIIDYIAVDPAKGTAGDHSYWVVATDVGNVMHLTKSEVLSAFYPSQYIRSEKSMDALLALVESKNPKTRADAGCCNQLTPQE